MTERDEAIRARCEAATPGPWVHPQFGFGIETADRNQTLFYVYGFGGQSHKDADFIAAAREDVSYLLDKVSAMESALAEAQRRAEAAEADLNHIAQEMFSDNSDDLRGAWYPCEVCKKYDGGKDCYDCLAASYDETKPGVAFEWRGPEGDKP